MELLLTMVNQQIDWMSYLSRIYESPPFSHYDFASVHGHAADNIGPNFQDQL